MFSAHTPSPKKLIIFNAGGVAKARVDCLKNLIMDRWGVLEEEAQEILNHRHLTSHSEALDHNWWQSYADLRGMAMPSHWTEQFSAAWRDASAPISGLLTLVKSLQQQGYKAVLISDYTPLEEEIVRKMGYYDVFSPIISSALIHSKSYKSLFKELRTSPSACLLIDDRQESIASARKAGMDAIYYISVSKLYEELEQRNIFLPCNTSELLFFVD